MIFLRIVGVSGNIFAMTEFKNTGKTGRHRTKKPEAVSGKVNRAMRLAV